MIWIAFYIVGVLLMGICGVGNVVLAIRHYGPHNPWKIRWKHDEKHASEASLSWYVVYMAILMPLLSWLGIIIELTRLACIKETRR